MNIVHVLFHMVRSCCTAFRFRVPGICVEHSRFPLFVQVLIENGADVHAEDTEENTALAVAASHGHLQIVGVLCWPSFSSRMMFIK